MERCKDGIQEWLRNRKVLIQAWLLMHEWGTWNSLLCITFTKINSNKETIYIKIVNIYILTKYVNN